MNRISDVEEAINRLVRTGRYPTLDTIGLIHAMHERQTLNTFSGTEKLPTVGAYQRVKLRLIPADVMSDREWRTTVIYGSAITRLPGGVDIVLFCIGVDHWLAFSSVGEIIDDQLIGYRITTEVAKHFLLWPAENQGH